MRTANLTRETKETQISVAMNLDGTGEAEVDTGVGFFDHMLTHLARHGLFDIKVRAKGDLHIDPHHTVEDVGICLGTIFNEAVGDASNITRFGHAVLPMDEALAEAVVDISGRPHFVFAAKIPKEKLGDFDSELAQEFLRAFAMNARITLHVNLRYGTNIHHCVEIIFKAVARALRQAVSIDPRVKGVPSTKGMLDT